MSINDWLTVLMFFAALRRAHPLPVAIVLLYVLHAFLDPYLTATAYYGLAALIDCVVCGLCVYVAKRSRPEFWVVLVACCSLASAAVNAVGWGLWYYYQPPTAYNWGITAVYAVMLLAFLWKGPKHGTGGRDRLRHTGAAGSTRRDVGIALKGDV